MREIKFRAWDGKKMFDPSSISWKNGVLWVCGAHGENKLEYELIAPNSQLMQFTGLLDKNSKEIYEEDIIVAPENDGRVYKVKWTDFRWGAVSGNGNERVFSDMANGEVIGNIYENPELTHEKH